jgi:Flp pilus assembly protein TadG
MASLKRMEALRKAMRAKAGDRGSELIELAIVLPILLVVFAAIVDFGFLFQRYEVITNAAREGARIGVLPGYSTADVTDRVEDYLDAAGLNSAAATITPSFSDEEIGTTGKFITVINVLVEYPSQWTVLGPIAGLVGGAGWTSMNLRAGAVMRTETSATSGGGS